MKIFRTTFLLIVGAVSIAYREAGKSLEQAAQALEERRERLGGWDRRLQR